MWEAGETGGAGRVTEFLAVKRKRVRYMKAVWAGDPSAAVLHFRGLQVMGTSCPLATR